MIKDAIRKLRERLSSFPALFTRKNFILYITENGTAKLIRKNKINIIQISTEQEFKKDDHKRISIHFKKTNTIVIRLKISSLRTHSTEDKKLYIIKIKSLLNSIRPLLKHRLRIYLELSGLNALVGLNEYCDEKNPIIYSIYIEDKMTDMAMQISTAYQQFIEQIQNGLLIKTQNSTKNESAQKLYLLAEQLSYFKNKLLKLISELDSPKFIKNQHSLKGIYFTTNLDSGNVPSYNFLPGILSEQPEDKSTDNNKQIIPIAEKIRNHKSTVNTLKSYTSQLLSIVVIFLFLLMIYFPYSEYRSESKIAMEAKTYLNEIGKFKIENISGNGPMLNNAFRMIDKLIIDDRQFKLLPKSYSIKSGIHNALMRNQDLLKLLQDKLSSTPIAERLYNLIRLRSELEFHNTNLAHQLGSSYRSLFIDRDFSQSLVEIFTTNYEADKLKLPLRYAQQENDFLDLHEYIPELWNNESEKHFERLFQNHLQNYWKIRLALIHFNTFNTIEEAELSLELLADIDSPLTKLVKLINKLAPKNSGLTHESLEKFDYKKLSSLLIQNNKTLKLLKSSKEPGKFALELSQAYLEGRSDSELVSLVNFAKSAPFPLNQWIYEIARNIWELITQKLLDSINLEWQSGIKVFYNEFIKDHYPISESAEEVELNDFQQFFGPEHLVAQFFDTHFAPFFNKGLNFLEAKSREGLSLKLESEQLEFWNRLNFIQTHYFDPSTQLPSLKFNIKVLSLSRNTHSLKLSQAPFLLRYAHGPQFNIQFIWPSNDGLENTSLQLLDFSQHLDEIFFPGTWALFRLFNQADISEAIEASGILLNYEFPKQNCRLLIGNIHNKDIIKLTAFHELNFPEDFNLEKEPL